MPTQTEDPLRLATAPADDAWPDEAAGSRTESAREVTERAGDAAAETTQQVRDSVLGAVRQGRNTTRTLAQLWTEMFGRAGALGGAPADAALGPTRAVLDGGYDLLEQVLITQRQFIDRLIAEQRRFTEQLLTTKHR
jgi:hypothetical protein